MSKKGGSLSSDNVMSNMSNNVEESVSYPEATPNVITAKDIVQNYGTNYKTTGGSLFGLEKADIKGFTKNLVLLMLGLMLFMVDLSFAWWSR